MTLEIVKPGLATSVQDLGRPGYFHLGIPEGGAMDRYALRAANLLVGNPEQFATVVTEKLLTYALGRGVEYYDAPAVRQITRGAAGDDYGLASLIVGVVQSTPFQMRLAR